MSLAPITLPTDKSTAVIDNTHRSLRQDESGLSITVTVLNADNTAYDLTGKNLVFCENKQNNKIIIDNGHGDNCGTFIRNADNDPKGIFTYVLQENVYATSGRAWFEITDGNTVDSTKNFYFDVERDAPISVTDNDYIGSLKALETAMAGAQDKVTSDLADMENQINQYIANTNTASAAQIAQAVKNLTDQTTVALSNVDQYTQKLATLQSQWDSELQSIQAKASADTDSAVQAINDKYTNDFAQLKSDFTNWQTSTTQNYQTQVNDILAKVQDDGTEVANVQKQVDDTIAKMQTLTQQFSNVDFTQFLKQSALDNYYTKSEIDPMIANAGKLKTVNGIEPDNTGNIALDLSGYETKADATNALDNKADKSDVTTLQGIVTSQGTKISQNTAAIATKANSADVTNINTQLDSIRYAPQVRRTLGANDDANDIVDDGVYLIADAIQNGPTQNGNKQFYSTLFVKQWDDNTIYQVVYGALNFMFTRVISQRLKLYPAWKTIATSDDITTLQGRIAALENKKTPTMVACTQAEYAALTDKDPNTIYMIGG